MLYIDVKIGSRAALGRRGENKARVIRFDIREWQQLYGEGTIELLHRRGCDAIPYPCAIEVNGNYVDWPITNIDTSYCSNRGQYELVYTVGDVVVKTAIGNTYVGQSLDDPSEELPDPVKGYLEQILQASTVADTSARNAAASESAAVQSCNAAKLSEQNAKASENASAASAAEAKKAEGVKSVNGQYPDDNWNVNVLAWEEPIELLDTVVNLYTSELPAFEIIDGETYIVTLNDVAYTCTAYAHLHTNGYLTGISIGNPSLAKYATEDMLDNGVPFAITSTNNSATKTYVAFSNREYASVTLNVKHIAVHSINKKLLPKIVDTTTGVPYDIGIDNGKLDYHTANKSFEFTVHPANLEEIGYDSTKTEFTIPSSFVDASGKTMRVTRIGSGAFTNCDSLTTIIIPEGVVSIGSEAFRGCANLTSVVLPESLKEIAGYAFGGCSKLANIRIPNGITVLNDSTFYNCTSLADVQLPERLEVIGATTFTKCASLERILLPGSLRTIGMYAFSECSSLSSICIPYGVRSIEDHTFSRCSSLTHATIPGSVTRIGQAAFYECINITDLLIPNSVTSIGDSALRSTGLSHIDIPSSVSSLEPMVLSQCNNLISANIHANISSIAKDMFYECPELQSVMIPRSISDIADSAFYDCPKLSDVYFEGTEEEWKAIEVGAYCYALDKAIKIFCCKAIDACAAPVDHVHEDVIVNSSTAGSTKKFRITVDDAGTITATEVTT